MSKKIKDSRIKNQKEKAIKAIVSVYDEPSYYQQWQDELDAPRWYLEKTYPIFYKHFEKKFNKFIKDWDSMTGDKNIHPNLIKDLFIFYCRMITAEIKAESNIKDSIEYIEKNGFPKVKHNRVSLTTESFDQAINILFEVPELILASFDKEKNKWTEKQKKFIGNPIENRKGDRVNKYKRVITYVKCIKQRFEKISGAQTFACDIEDVVYKSFNQWKNRNTIKYWEIYDNITLQELDFAEKVIKKRIHP